MRSYDTITDNSFRVLHMLAVAPFAERRELAEFAGLPASSTLDALKKLEGRGLVTFVHHTRTNSSRVRRWCLTPHGIEHLAELQGTTVGKQLREMPLSAESQRSLLRRLDTAAALYRIAQEAAGFCGSLVGWRWRLAWPLDALLELPDGRGLALMRFGATLSWKTMRSRLGTLYGMQQARRCPPALLLLPGELEAQRLATDLRGRAIDLYTAVEDDVMHAPVGSAVWRALRDPQRLTLAQVAGGSDVLRRIKIQGVGSTARASMPTAALIDGTAGLDLTASELSMPARRLLDALYDWPLMSMEHLEALLGMSEPMLKKIRAHLARLSLVWHLRIGKTPELRQRNGTRLSLSPDGQRYLARRDRRREADLLAHWRITPDEAGDDRVDVLRYRLDGSKLRGLARELRHTDGMNRFVAMLASACRASADWNLRQALPPHRWERWFRYNAGGRSIKPDGTIELERRGRRQAYLLEYEQRATKPALMEEKLEKYQAYFGSVETRRDFDDRRATALLVFVDEAIASRFCTVASRVARRPIPMLVSSAETLADTGPLGRSWRSPWRLQRGYVSLAEAL